MLEQKLGPDTIRKIGEFIVLKEGRWKDGKLQVYMLPKGDGGGRYEVAGINERYHPHKTARLINLIRRGMHKQAYEEAVDYIVDYTIKAANYHESVGVDIFLMDCSFNRGPTGAVKILQHALKTAGTYNGRIDGKPGKLTLAACKKHEPEDLLPRLLLSRQWYEREKVGRNESSKFWRGLMNRWVDVYQLASGLGDPYRNLK